MSAVRERGGVRVLRPLLSTAPARLRATVTAAGAVWIEDPSNDNAAFARVRMRRILGTFAGDDLAAARIARPARRLGRSRAAAEQALAALLAPAVSLRPAGVARAQDGWR